MNVTIRLPDIWPIEKIDFLHDFVNDLHEAIWQQYGQALCEYWESQPPFEPDIDLSSDVDTNQS